jgi:hypothetical protein
MSNEERPEAQEIYVVYDDTYDRSRRDFPRPDVRPLEAADAEIFEKAPNACYIIRDFKPCDDRTSTERHNLYDMDCITIVFRSGYRIPKFYARNPLNGVSSFKRALAEAEGMIREGDPNIGEFAGLPAAAVADTALAMEASDRQRKRVRRVRRATAN